jgi:hypothetical protein
MTELVTVLKFKDTEDKPLYFSPRDISKVAIGMTERQLANWRCQKCGPKYYMVGSGTRGRPFYKLDEFIEWMERNPRLTAN